MSIRIRPAQTRDLQSLAEFALALAQVHIQVDARRFSLPGGSAKELGSSSLMLGVSPGNTQARRLYEQLGLRATMVEMRLDFV